VTNRHSREISKGVVIVRIAAFFAAAAALLASTTASHAAIQVKIGILNDETTPFFRDIAGKGSVAAARMAIEDFGAQTKGLDVIVLWADHRNSPDFAAEKAREWYDKEGVDAIFDVPNSAVALAVSEVTQKENKVFIDSGAATSDLTGARCSPNTIHWTYDTWELAHGTGSAVVKADGTSWFFLTADYVFGYTLERDTSAVIIENGGTVLGDVKFSRNAPDFSSYLLQAQASGAKVIGLASAGGDTINVIKQAAEFGIVQGGQKLAGLLVFITDVHALGLKTAQGLLLTSPFYWDLNAGTRAWSDRFMQETGRRPTMVQAGVYSSVLHYLKAVEAARSAKDGLKVVAKMKKTPAEDLLFGKSAVRADGRVIHDSYLFEVKTPAESKGPWDYYKLISAIPADKAFRPMNEGGCPLVAWTSKKAN
jgi:branched-chain amino acid transport system substrate-binding protein